MTKVWYMKPEVFRDFIMGPAACGRPLPTRETLAETHVLLREVDETDPEDVFMLQQAENWSPNGEARGLIQEKGLKHTSMSVGDVVEIDDRLLMADLCGFIELED